MEFVVQNISHTKNFLLSWHFLETLGFGSHILKVLDLIIQDPSISRKTLSETLGINPSAVQKHIDTLKQKGIISRESETTGFWEVHINKLPED
jgi:DNA-binding MarR family transcriptional regulator